MIDVCGRRFPLPRRRTAVFCIDGCGPDALDRALADGLVPRLAAAIAAGGLYRHGLGQMPSFTNPNNLSIVTGQPPRVHGISGNYYLDRDTGAEVPMNDPRFLRAPTILEKLEQAGVRTLCVTAKDKLRALLGAVREGGRAPLSVSAERAADTALPEIGVPSIPDLVGRPPPGIYDWDISHYALEMGLALAPRAGAQVVYVSTTDYVQHKDPPGGPLSDRFLARLDALLGAYLDEGYVVGLTADHGMNDKTAADCSPDVRYLEDLLEAAKIAGFRVILPITDPYVVHHGALGSFATVYLAPADVSRAAEALARVPGIERVLPRAEAAARFALPEDRIGDLVVLGDARTVLGKRRAYHDLSAVARGLRSHGGLHERGVPIVVTAKVPPALTEGRALSNADIFALVLGSQAGHDGGPALPLRIVSGRPAST